MEASSSTAPPQPYGEGLAKPPFGYRQWMLLGNPALFFDRLARDFGDFVHYRGLYSFYLVNHPALVKQVLQDTNHTFDKNSAIYNRFRNAFGAGLVVAEGQRWRRQRKLMQPLFGHQALQRFFDSMVDSATRLADRWAPACRDGKEFDLTGDMNDVTLQIAGRALFHDSFDQTAERIGRWTHVINLYSAKPPLPILRSLWFPSRLNRRLKRALAEFHVFLREMIDRRRSKGDSSDLIGMLLQARHEESGEPMSDREIAEEALGMVIGGHETSSSALSWLWCELDRHPNVREKLHAELDAVVGNGPLEPAHLPRLVYARMAIEETLRLHPPFWFENRNVAQDVELGGAILPRGAVVAFSRYSLHRHPRFWKDPERFDPERFRPEHEENKRSVYAHVPFGGGPRICIGVHFAMMELLVVLAIIARRYNVVLAASHRHEMAAHLTMTPKYGVHVRLEAR